MGKICKSIIVLALVAPVFWGCLKDENRSENESSSAIRFSLVQADELGLKSEMNSLENRAFLIATDNGKTLPVVCETSPMELNYDKVGTKGTRWNPSDDFTKETFGIYGWYSDGTKFLDAETVSYDSVNSCWAPATEKFWPKGSALTFVAVYPEGGCAFSNIAPDNMDFTYKVKESASDEKDLMLAYYSGTGNDGEGDLTFTHALTCVNFKAGDLVDVESIDEISLDGVYESKGCTVTVSKTPAYSWKDDDGSETFIKVTSSGTVAKADFSTLEDVAGYNFMLIPQDVQTKNVTLKVTLTTSSGQETFTKTLDNTVVTSKWEEGKKYTFVLGYDGGEVNVSVEDNVSANVKDNLVITNTGEVYCYIRAAIVGNWADSDGNVCATWNESDHGTWNGLCPEGWVKIGDYYYYRDPVKNGDPVPVKLFESYTKNDTTPISGSHLMIYVMAQAVKYDKDKSKASVTAAWGSDVADELNVLE